MKGTSQGKNMCVLWKWWTDLFEKLKGLWWVVHGVVFFFFFLIQGSDMIRVWKEIWQLLLQQLLLKHCDGGGLVIKSCLTLVTPWTIALHAPLSLGLPRQEYCSGLPFPSPRNLPDPGIEPKSLVSPAFGRQILYLLSHQGNPLKHYFASNNSLSKIRDSSWPTPTTMLLEKYSQGQSVM